MPETDSDTDPTSFDPSAGAGTEDTRTSRQRMFELSKELWSEIAGLARAHGDERPELKAAEQKALALSLYLKDEAE